MRKYTSLKLKTLHSCASICRRIAFRTWLFSICLIVFFSRTYNSNAESVAKPKASKAVCATFIAEFENDLFQDASSWSDFEKTTTFKGRHDAQQMLYDGRSPSCIHVVHYQQGESLDLTFCDQTSFLLSTKVIFSSATLRSFESASSLLFEKLSWDKEGKYERYEIVQRNGFRVEYDWNFCRWENRHGEKGFFPTSDGRCKPTEKFMSRIYEQQILISMANWFFDPLTLSTHHYFFRDLSPSEFAKRLELEHPACKR